MRSVCFAEIFMIVALQMRKEKAGPGACRHAWAGPWRC